MNANFSINLRSKTPLAEQLQAQIRQLIQEQILQPGDQLPTVRSLASQLRVHFNTVARAYQKLDQEGLIYTHQGRGAYVAEGQAEAATLAPVDQRPADQGQTPEQESIIRLVNLLEQEAAQLGMPLGQLLQAIQQQGNFQKSAIKTAQRHSTRQSKKRIHAAVLEDSGHRNAIARQTNQRRKKKPRAKE